MITSRDLELITSTPTPPRSGTVVTTAVLSLRGPCDAAALAELAAAASTFLEIGARHLVVDLSAATDADPALTEALHRLRRLAAGRDGELTVVGGPWPLPPELHPET